jgi:dienelactone hydrolase
VSAHANAVRSAIFALVALTAALPCCALAALSGTVQTVTFTGPVTQQPVTFSLYLPPNYSAGTNRFPVIYHLHGLGGMHNSPQTNLVPASHEAAVASGVIEPCLIVFPDGYRDSFWANSFDGAKPAETNVKHEIIPFVDTNYRTLATRPRRAVQGFSMGGFGAAKFATKFPETFAACVIYDGALLTWPQIQQRHPTEAAEIFNNDAAFFDLYSPWYWLTQNVIRLRASVPFASIVGVLTTENRAWRDTVLAQAIPVTYVETGLPHSLGPLMDAQGSNSWAFIARAFLTASSNDASAMRLRVSRFGDDTELSWRSYPGESFQLEHRQSFAGAWQALVTNIAPAEMEARFVHSNALAAASGYYRLLRHGTSPPMANFSWSGTNFAYADAERSFSGILLKPPGEGPFPAVIINHGAGSTLSGYALTRAREMSAWGMVCMAPTLTHVAGGETDAANMGNCPENIARALACADVLRGLTFVDSNRLALFGHSMGAFAAIGQMAAFGSRVRAASITSGGVIPDGAPGGTNNASPTVSEANPVRVPCLMIHCDADPVVPASRSQAFQLILSSNGVPNQRIILSSNSIPNSANWHNIHNDPNANTLVLTNTRAWFQAHGVLP